MRFVAVKTEQQQAAALAFRTRDLMVKQRTQLGIAIRGHLAEYGWVAPTGVAHLAMLADLLEGGEIGETLPDAARPMFAMMIEMLARLDERIAALDKEIARRSRESELSVASADIGLVPPKEGFRSPPRTPAGVEGIPRRARRKVRPQWLDGWCASPSYASGGPVSQ